jgi:CRP/FNR family transcriptional regulator, nitrogen fixation regulation protein
MMGKNPTSDESLQIDRGQTRPCSITSLDTCAALLHYHRGQEICDDEAGSACWFWVVTGMARRSMIRLSGRRQIVGLLLPGDFFGFPSQTKSFAIEAVSEDTIVRSYPRQRLETLARADPRIAQLIRNLSFEMISGLEEQILILGRTTAAKKVGSFLFRVAKRLGSDQAGWILLPMSRYDMADYLGLSVETVSRALSELRKRGTIALVGTRQFRIIDADAIEEGADGGSPS